MTTNQSIPSSAVNDETMQRLRAKIRHILGYCVYQRPAEVCRHEVSDVSDEVEITEILQALAAEIERAEVAAQTNAIAWAIGVVDDLHTCMVDDSSVVIDRTYKDVKNTLRDCYALKTGIDPAPNYPIIAELLQSKTGGDDAKGN